MSVTSIEDNWRNFNICVASNDGYAIYSQGIVEFHFENDKAEKITELLALIERELTDPTASLEKKFWSLILLKDASKKPSKKVASCIARNKGLLQQIFQISVNYQSPSTSKSGIPEDLHARYSQLAVECICFWKDRFGEGDSNTAETFRRLWRKLSKTITTLPSTLPFFETEDLFLQSEKAGIKEKLKGKYKLHIPMETEEQHVANPRGSRAEQNSNKEVWSAGVRDSTKSDKKSGSGGRSSLKLNEEKEKKRNEMFDRLRHELTRFRDAKTLNTENLLNFTGSSKELIWKAREAMLELNTSIKKLNAFREKTENQYPDLNAEENVLIKEVQEEDDRLLELDTYLQTEASRATSRDVIEKIRDYSLRKIPSPSTASNQKLNDSFSADSLPLESPDKLKVPQLQFPGLRSDKKRLSTYTAATPVFSKEFFDDNFQNEKLSYPPQGNSPTKKSGFQERAQSKSPLRTSSPEIPKLGEAKKSTPLSYNPEVSEQAIRKLLKTDKTAIDDLQKIKNGIVTSLQQRQKPVPWNAFDHIDKIKQEIDLNITKSRSLTPRGTTQNTFPDNTDSRVVTKRLQLQVVEQPPIKNDDKATQLDTPSTIQKNNLSVDRSELDELGLLDPKSTNPTQVKPNLNHANSNSSLDQNEAALLLLLNQQSQSYSKKLSKISDLEFSENENSLFGKQSDLFPDFKDISKIHSSSEKPNSLRRVPSQKEEIDPKSPQGKYSALDGPLEESEPRSKTNSAQKSKYPTKSDKEGSANRDSKAPTPQERDFDSLKIQESKSKSPGNFRLVKESLLFKELADNLKLSSHPKAVDQFRLAATRGKGCVFDNEYVNVNSKYSLLEEPTSGYRHLKVTLLFGNKTNATLTDFSITFVKDLNIDFLRLPEKTESTILPGRQIKVEFIVSIIRPPFTHLQIKCCATVNDQKETEDLSFKFLIPLTYNMFMISQTQITDYDFVASWKVPTRVILKSEPRLLTSPSIKTTADFSNALGNLIAFPGIIDETGKPKAYALMGVFELERKNVEYLIKINWILETKVVVFEIACTERTLSEGEFLLQTLQFLFSQAS